MRFGLVIVLAAAVVGIVAASALAYDILRPGDGVIEGVVTIGPWTPVEPIGGSHPPPEVYTSRKIVLDGGLAQSLQIPMNGTGYFRSAVPAGSYTLTMTNCTFLGCSRVFPMTVRVDPGMTTILQINIDTGIR